MRIKQFAGSLLVLLLMGCASSRITHSWKAENTAAKKYNKIMVLGLIRDADIRVRERMEDHLAGDLKDLGYQAVSSLKEYGPKAFDNMDEKAALDKLRSSGIDAVVTIVMLDKTRERHYVPGYITYSPYAIYYNRFWGYYSTMYGRIYSPGYYEVNTRYFWESNLYDMSSKELIYSAQTETFDPASVETLGHEYGKMIVHDMIKNNVLIK
jgi:hypothetical protein